MKPKTSSSVPLVSRRIKKELPSSSLSSNSFLNSAKSAFAILSVSILVACSGQESSTTSTAEPVGKSIPTSQTTENSSSLLASLAKDYPDGNLPAEQAAQAAVALSQNPSVFSNMSTVTKQTTLRIQAQEATNISPQVLSATDFKSVYRIQNTTLPGSYFYTISNVEKATALATNPNWNAEGTAFYAISAANAEQFPVYRFRNLLNGSYLYTAYEEEKTSILTNYGATYTLEGVAWRAQQAPTAGYVPLYRFRNLTNGTYLNTAYESERNAIITLYSAIFAPEGIAYYVQQSDPSVAGSALSLATSMFAAYDASLAIPGPIPASGAVALMLSDGCLLNQGYSKALAVAEYDADANRVASRNYEIGSTRTNITVLADRLSTNTDGTGHREIDVQYVINYLDGTKDESAFYTLIQGSSYGARMADGSVCSTPDNLPTLRFYGNRRRAQVFVNASNERADKFLLATGLAKTTAVLYNKFVNFGVRDPANVITYATVSGPGIKTTAGAAMTLKLVSPRLLRNAPEFAGKNGNYIDWKDTDNFRVCRTSTGSFATAETAECVAHGATSSGFGSFNVVGPIDSDTNFDAFGFVAGGVYTFKLYAGDGWKTINGQLGVTPVATYTSTLETLPMSTVALAGTLAVPNNKFAVPSSTTLPWQIATAIRDKVAIAVPLVWALPGTMPDARPLRMSALYSFEQGSTTAAGFYPATRLSTVTYPSPTASAAPGYSVPAPVAAMLTPSYAEITLEYTNRNGNFVRTLQTYD